MRGCVPKKLLVYGAHFAEDLEDARRFGWQLAGRLIRLADAARQRARGSYATQRTLPRRRWRRTASRSSKGTPSSPRRTACGSTDANIGAKFILIATGARPQIPQVPGIEHAITSNEAFHLERLPARILIAGGGYIANEFAGIFNELGSKVTLVNRSDQILRSYDAQIRDRLLQISMSKGIQFLFNSPLRADRAARERRARRAARRRQRGMRSA